MAHQQRDALHRDLPDGAFLICRTHRARAARRTLPTAYPHWTRATLLAGRRARLRRLRPVAVSSHATYMVLHRARRGGVHTHRRRLVGNRWSPKPHSRVRFPAPVPPQFRRPTRAATRPRSSDGQSTTLRTLRSPVRGRPWSPLSECSAAGSARRLGRRGRRFDPSHPDHCFLAASTWMRGSMRRRTGTARRVESCGERRRAVVRPAHTERGVAQPGRARHSGCRGRRFKSSRPDHHLRQLGNWLARRTVTPVLFGGVLVQIQPAAPRLPRPGARFPATWDRRPAGSHRHGMTGISVRGSSRITENRTCHSSQARIPLRPRRSPTRCQGERDATYPRLRHRIGGYSADVSSPSLPSVTALTLC
jgi:hypothetical protein